MIFDSNCAIISSEIVEKNEEELPYHLDDVPPEWYTLYGNKLTRRCCNIQP